MLTSKSPYVNLLRANRSVHAGESRYNFDLEDVYGMTLLYLMKQTPPWSRPLPTFFPVSGPATSLSVSLVWSTLIYWQFTISLPDLPVMLSTWHLVSIHLLMFSSRQIQMLWKTSDALEPLLCYSCITSFMPLLRHFTHGRTFAAFLPCPLPCLIHYQAPVSSTVPTDSRHFATEEMAI